MKKLLEITLLCTFFACTTANISAIEKQFPLIITKQPYTFNLSQSEIDTIVNQALKTFNVPGASIAIVMDDEIIMSKGYGLRNVAEKLPVTENTLFPIASCTKAFTASLLAELETEGKICLDDPVKKYIPEFNLKDERACRNLTIRDLLAHRTGFPRHDALWIFSSEISSDKVQATILDKIQHLEPQYNINEVFEYNNLMYSLAGILIEKVTGLSWQEAIASRFFIPLQMENSNTSIEKLQASQDFSLPYAEMNGETTLIPFRNPWLVAPGGAINSSVTDMAKWLQLQLNQNAYEDILDFKTIQKSRCLQISVTSPQQHDFIQIGYGLGWFIGKYKGYEWISHSGHIDGFSSDVSFLPALNFGVVILTNSSSDGMLAISCMRNQIIDKFLKINEVNWLEELKSNRSNIKGFLKQKKVEFDKTCQKNSSPHDVENYIGLYQHPAYGELEIKYENNTLSLTYESLTTLLYYKSDLIFSGEIPILSVYGVNPFLNFIFFKDLSGHINQLEVPFESFRSAKPVTFTRL